MQVSEEFHCMDVCRVRSAQHVLLWQCSFHSDPQWCSSWKQGRHWECVVGGREVGEAAAARSDLPYRPVALCFKRYVSWVTVWKHQQWLRSENSIYWDSSFDKSRAWDSDFLFLACSFISSVKSELQVSVCSFPTKFPFE